jgi:hypothetical protein
MKLASVSFHWKKEEVGGAQLPAAAMTSWAKRLGVTADNLAFTKSGKPSKKFVQPMEGIRTFRSRDFYDVVNSYDAVFFATPGAIKGPDNYEHNFKRLTVPFVTMIHGEYDLGLYAVGGVDQIVHHSMCKALVVMGEDAMPVWEEQLKPGRMLPFHPCTLPDLLLREDTQWPAEERSGLLYAARMTTVKHPAILAKLTRDDSFMAVCDNTVDVHGIAPIYHIEKNVSSLNPQWNRFPGFYNLYDVQTVRQMFNRYAFYWEVFGSRSHQWRFRRYNLSGIEAISAGCIPIVNPRYAPAPHKTLSFSASLDPFADWSVAEVVDQLKAIREHLPQVQARMRKVILNSWMSYEGVKKQAASVLDALSDSR